MIWDNEFKRYKMKENREEMRQDYDNKKAHVQMLIDKYKLEKKKGKLNKDELARIDDDKVRAEADIETLKDYMSASDRGIYGCEPGKDFPEGFNGQEQLIEGLHEIIEMLTDYMKQLLNK